MLVDTTASDETRNQQRAIVFTAAESSGTPIFWFDDAAELLARMPSLPVERLRALAPVSDDVLRAAHAAGVAVDTAPLTGDGELELAHWVKEQAVSITRHRHGRLLGNAH